MTAHELTAHHIALHADTLNHLERAILERDRWRLLCRAALDQLALVATAPERYEQIQREARKELECYMAAALRGDAS